MFTHYVPLLPPIGLRVGCGQQKTCTKKHLLRSSYRLRQVPIKKEKSEPLPKPKKLARPLGKTSTYAKLPTYVAYVEARVAPGVLRPVHCPARRPRPPMALRHSIGRTYRHGLRAGFRAASAGDFRGPLVTWLRRYQFFPRVAFPGPHSGLL